MWILYANGIAHGTESSWFVHAIYTAESNASSATNRRRVLNNELYNYVEFKEEMPLNANRFSPYSVCFIFLIPKTNPQRNRIIKKQIIDTDQIKTRSDVTNIICVSGVCFVVGRFAWLVQIRLFRCYQQTYLWICGKSH